MACVDACSQKAIVVQDEITHYNAVIDPEKCVECGACYRVCQNNGFDEESLHEPVAWHQGWAKDPEVRKNSSSGGFAQAISRAFLDEGGVVCSCRFLNGEYAFALATTPEEAAAFCGSKYTKSNAIGAYTQVKEALRQGNRVLFIGLPCQVAAMKRYIPKKWQEQLYTIDLICHGTPSPKILSGFLAENGRKTAHDSDVTFREGNRYQLRQKGKAIVGFSDQDAYSYAFLKCAIFTDNCYRCRFAQTKRGGDLTLGDSWGSDLPPEEHRRGISLALVQTEKGRHLLSIAPLHLAEVDSSCAIAHNGQLSHPSVPHPRREAVLSAIRGGGSTRKALASLRSRKQKVVNSVKFFIPWKLRTKIKGMLSKK